MTTAIKTISGITGLLTIGGPTAYVGWVAWDGNNPTGEKWLLDSGYNFSKPTFTSHENLGHGCSENLFSTTSVLDESKVYGCAVMKMEKTEDNNFIKFNSEVSLRKGDDGWIINTMIDNHHKAYRADGTSICKFDFAYVFTKKNLKTGGTERWIFWDGGTSLTTNRVYIKIPSNVESPLYDGGKLTHLDNQSYDLHHKEEIIFSATNEYYGVWVSKEDGNSDWIFKNIEMWVNEKQYSEIFCGKETTCEESTNGNGYAYKIDDTNADTWLDSEKAMATKEGQTRSPTGTSIYNHIKTMIDAIKGIRGDWVDMKEICDLRRTRNLDNLQKQQLSMYCTNGKKSQK